MRSCPASRLPGYPERGVPLCDGLPERDGVPSGDAVPRAGERDGLGRWVEETRGAAPSSSGAFEEVAWSERGSARGASYAVPDSTVCTPNHDRVTAAPVASVQAAA